MKEEKQTIIVPQKYPVNYLEHATGPLTIRMTNDYLFKALLQLNNKALKGLIGALLHIPIDTIVSVEIRNPIELGKAIDEKDFYLDTLIELNNHSLINLEMQVINEHDWPERSLSYLCRTFNHLSKGESYINVKPVIHIGILDFTLFSEHPEFYATYKFMNIKNHLIYSDKLTLSVLDLTRTDLATEEDKSFKIDYWASLFKATTWEEIKMLAADNEYIQEASNTIYQLSQDESVYWQCQAREDYYRREAHHADVANRLTETEEQLTKTNEQLSEAEERLMKTKERLTEASEQLTEANEQLAEANEQLSEANEQLSEANERLTETNEQLAVEKKKRNAAEMQIKALQAEIARLKGE